jgi:hypothetical protein
MIRIVSFDTPGLCVEAGPARLNLGSSKAVIQATTSNWNRWPQPHSNQPLPCVKVGSFATEVLISASTWVLACGSHEAFEID